MIHRWSPLVRCSIQIPMGGQRCSQLIRGKPIDEACLEGCGASEREYWSILEIVIGKGKLLIVKSYKGGGYGFKIQREMRERRLSG